MSMNTENWFLRGRTSSATNQVFPLTIGNIQFLDFVYNEGSAKVIPTTPIVNLFYGDLGFNFNVYKQISMKGYQKKRFIVLMVAIFSMLTHAQSIIGNVLV